MSLWIPMPANCVSTVRRISRRVNGVPPNFADILVTRLPADCSFIPKIESSAPDLWEASDLGYIF